MDRPNLVRRVAAAAESSLLGLAVLGSGLLISRPGVAAAHAEQTQPAVASHSIAMPESKGAAALVPPPIPVQGAYLGAWVNPAGGANVTPASAELAGDPSQLATFDQELGRSPGIVSVYAPWGAAPHSPYNISNTVQALNEVSETGAIPMLSWKCGPLDATVASGAADAYIEAYATALRNYEQPMFLRWTWEMNKSPDFGSCMGTAGAASYVAAWQRIYDDFQAVGATNVAFVWAPSIQNMTGSSAFYPGDRYVDWIAVDGYSGRVDETFESRFGPFYSMWASHNKPLMISETGSWPGSDDSGSLQASYLAGMSSALQTVYPDIKAVVYFDAPGHRTELTQQYVLVGQGIPEFVALANSSYFSFMGTGTALGGADVRSDI